MKIEITCYPTYGGSGVIATELGKELALRGHQVHFISYALPFRLSHYIENILNEHVIYLEYRVRVKPGGMNAPNPDALRLLRDLVGSGGS